MRHTIKLQNALLIGLLLLLSAGRPGIVSAAPDSWIWTSIVLCQL
jgi:hypothetical protein